jgi:hypothetical protein
MAVITKEYCVVNEEKQAIENQERSRDDTENDTIIFLI